MAKFNYIPKPLVHTNESLTKDFNDMKSKGFSIQDIALAMAQAGVTENQWANLLNSIANTIITQHG